MTKTLALASVAALIALSAGPAAAQRGQSITLFDGVDYQGQSRNFGFGVENLADQGFNDRAQSLRVQGRWRVCEDSRLRGRCVEVSGDVPNLAALRLTGAISSFENLSGGGGFNGGGNFGGGNNFNRPGDAGPSLDGRTASFFASPPSGFRNADDFCRRMGFSGVIYADDRSFQLRDVLCRR